MKLRFYLDVWPGSGAAGYWACTNPCQKTQGSKRIAFDVVIPDELIHEYDAIAPEVGRPEVVLDHSDEDTER